MRLAISKLGKFQALWDEVVTLVKIMVRYAILKEKHKAQPVRSGKSKPGV